MNTKKILFYALAFIIGGCVPSLHPLYTNKELVFEQKLLGKWVEGQNNVWDFKKSSEPNAYDLSVIMDKKEGGFTAHLVKINDTLFLDLFPKDPNLKENDFYKLHLLPVHTFMKVDEIEPALKLAMMAPDVLKKNIDADPNLIKHETLDNTIVLTASTQQLQQFMKKYANDPNIFAKPIELERFDPNEHSDPNANK